MSKKLVSVLVLILLISVILCACANQEQSQTVPSSTDPTTAPTSAPTEPPKPTEPSEPSEPSEPDVDDPDEPVEEPEDEPFMNELKALYGASEPNGYGIWSPFHGFPGMNTVCVDTKGNLTFEVDSSESNATEVCHGAVIMKVNYDYYILRSATDGKVLFDSSSEDGAVLLLPDHAGKKMFRDGYVMIMKAHESVDNVTYELGFMNPKGEWIQELSADNALLKYLPDINTDSMQRQIVYMGEGILGILCSDNVYRYYSIDTNTCVTVESDVGVPYYTLLDELEYRVFFKDGISEPVFMNNNFYLFYSNGSIEAYKVLWPIGEPGALRQGNPYFDRETKTAYFLYCTDDGILVADQEGNICNRYKNVRLKESLYYGSNGSGFRGFADDGYARIILQNNEGTAYYAIVGVDGKFLFNPVKLASNIDAVFSPDGYHIDVDSISGYRYNAVIDYAGKVIYQSDLVDGFSVKNGVAYFVNDEEEFYIDVRI